MLRSKKVEKKPVTIVISDVFIIAHPLSSFDSFDTDPEVAEQKRQGKKQEKLRVAMENLIKRQLARWATDFNQKQTKKESQVCDAQLGQAALGLVSPPPVPHRCARPHRRARLPCLRMRSAQQTHYQTPPHAVQSLVSWPLPF